MGRVKIDKFEQKLLGFKKVGLDSMCFIYQFAEHASYASLTEIIFDLLGRKRLAATTSTISVIETFTRPEILKNQPVVAEYERVFQQLPNLSIVSIDWYIARLAAKLRAEYKFLKTPDSLQISAPLLKNYPAFITNNRQLKKVKEIEVVVLKDYL